MSQIQSVSLPNGGEFSSFQHATGQDFQVTDLPHADGTTVFVDLVTHGEKALMSVALAKAVTGGAITFKQYELYDRLISAYQVDGLFRDGNYRLRIISLDGGKQDIDPPPKGPHIEVKIEASPAFTLPDTMAFSGLSDDGNAELNAELEITVVVTGFAGAATVLFERMDENDAWQEIQEVSGVDGVYAYTWASAQPTQKLRATVKDGDGAALETLTIDFYVGVALNTDGSPMKNTDGSLVWNL